MVENDSKKKPQKTQKYFCENCDYNTCNKTDFSRHLSTDKHQVSLNDSKKTAKTAKNAKKQKNHDIFKCICGKIYKYDSGLYRHKNKCNFIETQLVENETVDYKELFLKLIEQNNKLTTTITDLIPKVATITNNTTNNINNKFNIQIFLNEQCKNAISMDEFIKQIEISVSNLLITKDKGLADGISNIFIENMNKLPIHERPLHCTDIKRETLYIKNDTWEKDDKKEMIKDAIQKVSKKQSQNITKFKEEKPKFMENQKDKDDFIEIVKTSTDNIVDKEDKVIKTLCKNVYINEKMIEK